MPRPSLGAKAAAVRETIAELCADPPEAPELVDEVAQRVRRVVPYDTGAWMTTDPQSMLPTSLSKIGGSPELSHAFGRMEMLGTPDVNTFGDMVARGATVAALSLQTGGRLEQAERYRELHIPFGLRDELRLIARSQNEAWAIGCVTRAADVPDFSEEEVRWVATIADHLGHGVRRALGRSVRLADRLTGPGMLVLDAAGAIEAATGEAERWLASLPQPDEPGMLPVPIKTVALQAQANAAGVGTERLPRVRLQMRNGAWLLVHADVLHAAGQAAAKVAVVLEPADRAELLPLLLALHGLTSREREVAELLVAGFSTDEIATRMFISRHTLRDHTKAIFAKVGVGSRPELTAALGLAA